MKLVRRGDRVCLEHAGRSVPMDPADLACLERLKPLGRKVYFRNKAKGLMRLMRGSPEGECASTLLQWWHLPAQEWSFGPPQKAEEEEVRGAPGQGPLPA